MLSENDKQNLLRNFKRNRVVLVTGAGFSADTTNSNGEHLPNSKRLAELLWNYIYDEPYDGISRLPVVYSAALRRRGVNALRGFLSIHLGATEIPDWYKLIPKWFWHRIYTFNVDDVLEKIYKPAQNASLQRVIAPSHFQERDQFLRSTQYVKLHGSLDDPKDLTFGPKEYASRAAARADIWYLHFIEDYSTLPTVFVGTELDEQLFWQYVALRGSQAIRGDKVRRAKCLLVNPTISKPHEEELAHYGIIPIRATGEEFFRWLADQEEPATREDVLRETYEGLDLDEALAASQKGIPTADVTRIEYFLSIFRMPTRPTDPRKSPFFLLGAPPTWDDIAADMDAHREINDDVNQILRLALSEQNIDIILITSTAGGGKSTVCRRAAIDLVDDGYTVYFSDGTMRPDPDRIADHILRFQQRVVLFFDNAGGDFGPIARIWSLVKHLEKKPLFVVAARVNDAAYKSYELHSDGARLANIDVPNLTDPDIYAVLETLERHDLLGTLKESTKHDQYLAFKQKARKQILVAMREATSGLGFDEILVNEYNTLQPESAKLLYLITALASNDDYGLGVQQMISAMDLPPNETQILVEKNLSGILVQHENDPSRYFIRHPAIAHFIVRSAPRETLADAIVALMISLATVIPEGSAKKTSRAFRLYRGLLSHTEMQTRFVERPDLARKIYQEIMDYYRDDGHYWLHHGAFEVEQGGDISLAENYLAQAAAIMPHSRQVETATAHLLFKKAKNADNASIATDHAEEALKIIRSHMADSAHVSLHALLIYGRQMNEFIHLWIPPNEKSERFRRAYLELKQAVPDHMTSNQHILGVLRDLKRSELETSVESKRTV